ncbi:Uncharacterized protein K02A2.6 [Stylophora pistillata]|uniref:Uncharacterized protein K02A2.6 n=1 Tax=Stylophora pistillata TaxID=50429 RepID=A0A2B4SAF4_STYPI|nr:Uncharacterized protein K02A2.6 [Stylophora pistillata]
MYPKNEGYSLLALYELEYSYSDFVEVGELKGTTAIYIMQFLKEQFSRYGIPDVLVTDNGPQYTYREFTEFSRGWEFKHVTSSPRHAKSSGKAEAEVNIAKKIFKKAYEDNMDPWLALLDPHNTPTQGVNSSPAQRLMVRRTHTLLSISANLLYPRIEKGVKGKLKAKRQNAKSYHDRGSKSLPEREIDQGVRVAGQRNRIWEAGTCVQMLSDHSYLVEVNGDTVRQNREALRPKYDTPKTNETVVTETKSFTPAPVQTGGQVALTDNNHSEVKTTVEISDTQHKSYSTPLRTTASRLALH